MIRRHNSKRFLASLLTAVFLAVLVASAPPTGVIASNAASQPVAASVLATLELAAGQVYGGARQFATDMRSLYSVYQLQAAPDSMTASRISGDDQSEAQLILCEIFRKPMVQKKKCRT